ncbi:hypothetical protein [Spirillospora sp. NPDC048819]|uniref:hypothetical protein n=1 Tax=Spirillospora sp. NPDC048819 TaxID=3155268 RepID=UPI0033C16B6B
MPSAASVGARVGGFLGCAAIALQPKKVNRLDVDGALRRTLGVAETGGGRGVG